MTTPPEHPLDRVTAADSHPPPPVEALDIRPGDTLIVRYTPPLSREAGERIEAELRAQLPGIEVLILSADGMARYRPDTTTEKE